MRSNKRLNQTFLTSIFVFLMIQNLGAQVKIYPSLGFGAFHSQSTASQGDVSAMPFKFSPYFAGIDLSFWENDHSKIGIFSRFTRIGLAAKTTIEDTQPGQSNRNQFQVNMLSLGAEYTYKSNPIHLLKKPSHYEYISDTSDGEYRKIEDGHRMNFRLEPFIGFSILKPQKNVNWEAFGLKEDLTTFDTLENQVRKAWDLSKYKDKNILGSSIVLGLKYQAINRLGKEKLSISVLYNFGLQELYNTQFIIKHPENGAVSTSTANLLSKGSFFAVYLSYPIRLSKEKIEVLKIEDAAE